jgi:hypothetical protein
MKYVTEITIDLPRARTVELFEGFETRHQWQPGLQTYEPLEGEPGQPGARTRLVYDEDGRAVELIETVVERDLPHLFTATYEARNLYNLVRNRFIEDGPDRTRWQTENEFEFKGFMRLLGWLIRGAFPQQTLRDMNRFKEFAEDA